jgi:HAD superfamily hydrolase (TIGR01459 family)
MELSEPIAGLGDVIDRYRVILTDAYGVLHDGRKVFPGVNESLQRARTVGKTVTVVTNSPQRIEGTIHRLDSVGVDRASYDHIASSGELTWRDLEERNRVDGALPRVHFILQGSGVRWLSDVRNERVDAMDDADLIIAAGMPYATEPEALASPMIGELERAYARGLPMLVADSDETYPEDGMVRLGPGWIAKHYANLGGAITEYGKPFDPIYDLAIELVGTVQPHEVLMIGDNLKTDILGASRRGFHSMMVLEGGVHGWLSPAELAAFSADVGVAPTYVAPSLRWQ